VRLRDTHYGRTCDRFPYPFSVDTGTVCYQHKSFLTCSWILIHFCMPRCQTQWVVVNPVIYFNAVFLGWCCFVERDRVMNSVVYLKEFHMKDCSQQHQYVSHDAYISVCASVGILLYEFTQYFLEYPYIYLNVFQMK
jgi:hypothetical protein